MFDLVSGTPGAEGAAGRCRLVEHVNGDWIEYAGYFSFRKNEWTLYRLGGEKLRRVAWPREVRDCRRRPEPEAEAKTEKKAETRTQWWRLPDPPGQIKLGE